MFPLGSGRSTGFDMTSGSHRSKAPVVTLVPNKARALEAVLCLLNEALSRSCTLTQYQIGKSVFIADRAHMNQFGRPITFDNFVAMKHGPVPRFVYDVIKSDEKFRKEFGCDPLWQRKPAPERGNGAFEYSAPARQVDLDVLSESDISALRDALSVVLSLTFSQIRKLTHDDPAYVDAWEDLEGRKSFPMSLGLLFEVPNYERAEDIAYLSSLS